MSLLRVLLLALIVAAGTLLLGWWAVPAIAALYALLRRHAVAPGEAALAALMAWAGLLLRAALVPAFPRLLERLGGIFPVPGVALLVIALLFAGALAWSAARLVTAAVVRHRRADA